MPISEPSTDAPGARGALLAVALLGLCAFADGRQGGEPFEPALASPPLPPPLVVTGGFCEFRIGHFHAGLDLGTDQRVGKPVLACGDGWVERIRCSGVGYGRSIYLRLEDGRLIQYGHLDAFVEPLAAYVRARQDSSLQYEQDMWPEAGRFRFRAGERMAWTGESGAGGPHLHFEIRRGDMAYHPMRAGLSIDDTNAPSIQTLTLEPLDEASFVEGGAAPFTAELGADPETLRVIGRVRVVVGARDGVWRGVDRMVPWSVAMEWEGRTVECRFDSVSWATDMAEDEYVYDAGRVVGEKGLVLWAPEGFRPRVIHADEPPARDAGTVEVRAGDKPRALKLVARDLAGGRAERSVVLIADGSPSPLAMPRSRPSAEPFEVTSLPGGWARFTVPGAPAGTTKLTISSTALGRIYKATPGERGWSLVMPLGVGRKGAWSEEFFVRVDSPAGKVTSQAAAAAAVDPRYPCEIIHGHQRASFPEGAVFEPSVVLFHRSTAAAPTAELEPASLVMALAPRSLPLRKSARITLSWTGESRPGLGLYREGSDGWEWIDAKFDTVGGRVEADTRRLGRFGLFRDGKAPRLTLHKVPRRGATGPYSRWAAEAAVVEEGSGLDGRASYAIVDGRRVPTEWDSEERILRWRPVRRPRQGTHRWEVVAVDRAGNTARARGTFVLD